MDANTRKLERIFDQTITYQVPLFQRPYVWTQENNWVPLWEDIQNLLDKHFTGQKVHPHFLGAVVLEQLANSTGSIESRQVIDGQQRFTTLQLFLIAARDLAALHAIEKYTERFSDLVANRRNKIDHDDEVFKVWPTNTNRVSFKIVHQAGSLTNLDLAIKQRPELNDEKNNIIAGYRFFYSQLASWINSQFDLDDEIQYSLNENTITQRFESLWHVVKDSLQLVVIDLDANDETQVIFETLNARGEDLLPADLIKNFLFRRAAIDHEKVEALYDEHWQKFESEWWRKEITQGRITRPRVDVFIHHYLVMMLRDDIKLAHLFNEFKAFVNESAVISGSLLNVPKTAAEHIIQLSYYAEVFIAFSKSSDHQRLSIFLRRLEAIDTNTIYPFLLYSYAHLMPDNQDEFDKILILVESYLIRRMICGMTGKNYNRIFVDLIRTIDKQGILNAETVTEYLKKSAAESMRYPDNQSLRTAIFDWQLYNRLPQYKVRAILEALDAFAYTSKSEQQILPQGLTIEHVMPQDWKKHWPLDQESLINAETQEIDPFEEQQAIQLRKKLINSLGNLTLITGSLNPALSNSAWSIKRPELLKFSKLNLTQYFHGQDANVWNEKAIEKRTEYLFNHLLKIWPALSEDATD